MDKAIAAEKSNKNAYIIAAIREKLIRVRCPILPPRLHLTPPQVINLNQRRLYIMKGHVARNQEIPFQDLGGGVQRRVLSYNEELMTVEVAFQAGAVGAVHTHPHTQCTYVLSGRFSYSVEEESVILGPGDSIVVPASLPHGTTCLEQGVLLDIFTPMRKDFI